MCTNPMKAFYTGFINPETGRKIYQIKPFNTEFIHAPSDIATAKGESKNYQNYLLYDYTEIPCGKCIECQMKKRKEWAFRVVEEAKQYKNNIMITLTYNDENLPNKGNLEPQDFTNFIKRLRRYNEDVKIRYFGCGEYGSEKGRPHYHIILFNYKPNDLKFYKMSKCEWSSEKNKLYKSEKINKVWGKGFVDCNEVNYNTAAYVAGYVNKKMYKPGNELGKVPEFIRMSRRPGIGYNYYEKNKNKIINDEKVKIINKNKIIKIGTPRYYIKQLEKEDLDKAEELKEIHNEQAKESWKMIAKETNIPKDEYYRNRNNRLLKKSKTARKRNKIG